MNNYTISTYITETHTYGYCIHIYRHCRLFVAIVAIAHVHFFLCVKVMY